MGNCLTLGSSIVHRSSFNLSENGRRSEMKQTWTNTPRTHGVFIRPNLFHLGLLTSKDVEPKRVVLRRTVSRTLIGVGTTQFYFEERTGTYSYYSVFYVNWNLSNPVTGFERMTNDGVREGISYPFGISWSWSARSLLVFILNRVGVSTCH